MRPTPFSLGLCSCYSFVLLEGLTDEAKQDDEQRAPLCMTARRHHHMEPRETRALSSPKIYSRKSSHKKRSRRLGMPQLFKSRLVSFIHMSIVNYISLSLRYI